MTDWYEAHREALNRLMGGSLTEEPTGDGTAHLVQFSTGAGSAEVAFRVHAGAAQGDRVVLLTADTMVEDNDNWRFAYECVEQMPGVQWVILSDGRNPMEVGRDARCVPNNRMAVCSRVLKRDLIRAYMEEHYDPAESIVYLGFDWTEEHRLTASLPHWEPWKVQAPLMDPPYVTKAEILDRHRALGIEPVRLYEMGFSHANCGGGCVRGGHAQWALLLDKMPERFAQWEREEQTTRGLLGKDVAILRDRKGGTSKPLTLADFRRRLGVDDADYDHDDWGACGCFMEDVPGVPTSEPLPVYPEVTRRYDEWEQPPAPDPDWPSEDMPTMTAKEAVEWLEGSDGQAAEPEPLYDPIQESEPLIVTTEAVKAFGGRTNNAELIADCATLGYLRDEWLTLDPTYGKGRFWGLWRPASLVTSDLDPERSEVNHDFRKMPYDDDSFDAVVFDPPYKLCLDTETQMFSRRGWLRWDEVRPGVDEAYSLNMDTGLGEWRKVRQVHHYPSDPTEVMVCEGVNLNFVATPDHAWPVASTAGVRRWRTTDSLSANDRVIHSAIHADTPTSPIHNDATVELIAWLWTEGHIDRPSTYGTICQSHAVNGPNCERIEGVFRKLYGDPTDVFARTGRTSTNAWRIKDEERNRRFIFSASIGAQLLTLAPNKIPSREFIESLTLDQLHLFIDISLVADGQNEYHLAQKNEAGAEAFRLACILAGRPIATYWRDDGNGHATTIRKRSHSKPLRPGVKTEVREVAVWCPTIEGNSTWLARREGRIYFTGNSGTASGAAVDTDYGIVDYLPWQEKHEAIRDGITECVRVLKSGGMLLVKCQDQVCSGQVRWQTREFAAHAEMLGCRLVDMLHVENYRAQPPGRKQVHARRNYSTMLVLRYEGE